MIQNEDKCEIHCTDNDRNFTVEVGDFNPEKYLTVYLAGNKIVMNYNKRHSIYVGTLVGKEFTTKGPKFYEFKQRGFK